MYTNPGNIQFDYVNSTSYIRPVIVLRSNVLVTYDISNTTTIGTYQNPYLIS